VSPWQREGSKQSAANLASRPLSETMEELEPRPSLRLLAPLLGPLVVLWLAAAALIAAQIS